MFREIMDFSYRRTALQAFGWYLIFSLIAVVAIFVLGAIFVGAGVIPLTDIHKYGALLCIPYVVVLGVSLLWNRPKTVANILILLAAAVLSVLFSGLGGLIPLAVLTTRPIAPSFSAHAIARTS